MRDKRRLSRDNPAPELGMVHFGPGAFFRAFNAIYTDDVIADQNGAWGIVAVSLRSSTARDQLKGQDNLYTAVELTESGKNQRVVGSISDVYVATEDPKRVVECLSNPSVKVVTLTITEKGYCHNPSSGDLNFEHPDIVHDINNLSEPISAIGFLVAGLAERKRIGINSFTIVSCDNLPSNGKVLRELVLQFAGKVALELATWIAENARFPSTMVDRITPATTDTDVVELERSTGVFDPACVVHEPFRQWVIEDQFVNERPKWENVGAQFVTSVEKHEFMKLRCLNGTHSSLAYLGYLAGFQTISEVSNNGTFASFCMQLWRDEILPTLPQPEGEDLQAYCETLLRRYQNPSIRHKTWQIAMDGSQKLPQRILGTIANNLEMGRVPSGLCLAVAAWFRYVSGIDESGEVIDVRDPMADTLKEIHRTSASIEDKVTMLLAIEEIFDQKLANNKIFVDELVGAYQRLEAFGALASVDANVHA